MAKIIFLTPPAHGHLNPVLPVMHELVRRGEWVLCYNNQEFGSTIEQTGAEFRSYPETQLSAAALSKALEEGNLAKPHLLMLQASEALTPFVLDELRKESCDLAVFDSLAIWGKIAANSLKLKAAATISHFVFDLASMNLKGSEFITMMGQFFSQAPHLLRARRRLTQRYGEAYPPAQPLFPMRDRLNIVFTSRDLQPASSIIDDTFCFVGPSIDPQVRRVDFPFDALEDKPIVYLTMGTVHHMDRAFYKACFEAFADYPAQFILSAGGQAGLEEPGSVPSNFLLRPFVPQLEILQRADVFITHGGINSVHEGLYYGVPLLLIPHQFEQLLNARCVARRGAGWVIESRMRRQSVTAVELRQALENILSESHYREAARELQQSMRATGGYQEAANRLQAYVSEQVPG